MFQAVKVDPKEGIAAAIARKKEQVSCSRAFVCDGINSQEGAGTTDEGEGGQEAGWQGWGGQVQVSKQRRVTRVGVSCVASDSSCRVPGAQTPMAKTPMR